jgi:hypothetical protein
MYALNNDEHTYEGYCIQLTGFYIWALRRPPLLRKAVRISVRKETFGPRLCIKNRINHITALIQWTRKFVILPLVIRFESCMR